MAAPQQGVKRLKSGGKPMYGEVRSTQHLTLLMVRVVLGGGDLDGFVPTPYSDQYINAQFFPDGEPYTAPFNPADFEALDGDRGQRVHPFIRFLETLTFFLDFFDIHRNCGYN